MLVEHPAAIIWMVQRRIAHPSGTCGQVLESSVDQEQQPCFGRQRSFSVLRKGVDDPKFCKSANLAVSPSERVTPVEDVG